MIVSFISIIRARQRNEEIIAFPLYESSEEDMASSCSSDIELPDRKDELIEEMLSLKGLFMLLLSNC